MSSYDELRAAHADAIARARAAIDGVGQNFADDPSVQLASTVDYLSAERDEWKRRAEAAEAQLAAVPDYASYYTTAVQLSRISGETPMTFAAWLADAQPEVQP